MSQYGHTHRADPHTSLVEFIVGDVHYAVGIGHVHQIVNPLPVTPLPHTPPEISGVADYRGDVVPILDLRARFGLPPSPPSRSTRWILVNARERLVGLVVDSVPGVFGTNTDDVRATPSLGSGRDLRGIAGVTNHNGSLVFVLDVKRFTEIVDDIADILPPYDG